MILFGDFNMGREWWSYFRLLSGCALCLWGWYMRNPLPVMGAGLIFACSGAGPQRPTWLWPGLGLVFFLFLPPYLSDDYHRYLWEGHVANQGFSPYRNAPNDLADSLEHPSLDKVNHPHLTAIYPPLAQLVFRLSDLISHSVLAWKLLLLAGYLAAMIYGFFKEATWTGIFASGLLLIEGLWQAHVDGLALLPLVWLIQAAKERQSGQAGVALACLVGLKLVPLMWTPFLFLAFEGRQRWLFLLSLIASLCLIFLPFAADGLDLFRSFLLFSKDWYFNNPIFYALQWLFDGRVARLVMGLVFCLIYALLLVRPLSLFQRLRASWIALICLGPTFYPWYLLWLLPLVFRKGLSYLNGAFAWSLLSYWVLIGYWQHGRWEISPWWLIPEWIGLYTCFYLILRKDTPQLEN